MPDDDHQPEIGADHATATAGSIAMAIGQGFGITAFAGLLGATSRRPRTTALGAAIAVAASTPYLAAVARHRPYSSDALGVARWFVDSTWSAPNTLAGAAFFLHQRTHGNSVRPERTIDSGTIDLARAAIGGYATTVGTVVAGSRARLDAHERVHVTQERVLGPFYGPLVALDYIRLIVVPTWWRDHDHHGAPIVDVATYLQRGVYRRVWHERWAYGVAPAGSEPLSLRATVAGALRHLVPGRQANSERGEEWAQQDSNL